jgi:hypothetical protein
VPKIWHITLRTQVLTAMITLDTCQGQMHHTAYHKKMNANMVMSRQSLWLLPHDNYVMRYL